MINILFAHSDPKLIQLYANHMSHHFSFDSATDGLTALRKLKLAHPRVIVSDYHLPFLSGLALLKFVRTTPQYATTPFVFLTDHKHAQEALSLGASDWLDLSNANPDMLTEKIYHHIKVNQTYGL